MSLPPDHGVPGVLLYDSVKPAQGTCENGLQKMSFVGRSDVRLVSSLICLKVVEEAWMGEGCFYVCVPHIVTFH